jgi:WD40 repeat protein
MVISSAEQDMRSWQSSVGSALASQQVAMWFLRYMPYEALPGLDVKDAHCHIIVCGSAGLPDRLYNTMTGSCLATLTGHTGEISKVAFNPQVSFAESCGQAVEKTSTQIGLAAAAGHSQLAVNCVLVICLADGWCLYSCC